jgi:Uri superfamily endonuclease
LLKAVETPKEKRLRRLLKKAQKERKRKEQMGWHSDYLYTNTNNPFGKSNVLATFLWTKKLEKEGLISLSRRELEVRNRQKQEENRRELEKESVP